MTVADSPGVSRRHFGKTWERDKAGRFVLPRYTLGWQLLDWTYEYLRQPDGEKAGDNWRFTDEQARFWLWWYAVDEAGRFLYRSGMLRRVKGWGKDPKGAVWLGTELCGPVLFDGWDAHGEPVGRPHPSPWCMTAAVSLEQTQNTMSLFPRLFSDDAVAEFGLNIGKETIYSHNGKLEAVTSSPRAAEGKRTTATLKNETQHWLANNEGHAMSQAIARNATKVKGRVLAISNAHDPGEGSDAELDYENAGLVKDFLYDSSEADGVEDVRDPDVMREALLIARGDSTWLDVDDHVLAALDRRNSEGDIRRFYLNQIWAGSDDWFDVDELWVPLADPHDVPEGAAVVVGFDGSDVDDWTGFRCETKDGYQFTPRFDDGKPMVWNPHEHGGLTPRHEVNAAMAVLMKRYRVARAYCDPPYWQSEIDEWAAEYGEKTVVRWATYRPRAMGAALERLVTDLKPGVLSHDGCPITERHLRNARPDRRLMSGEVVTLIRKDRPKSANKIDMAMSSALCHEAWGDVTTANEWPRKRYATAQFI